ncbi:glutathione S-transferase [Piscinibacter sp. XHJ-5]|uniref:glutathione S-transferase family protein n=1 Tax=Piscinibacter sp. XHJ-5 TaxID=3037797 RepID=UPI00245330D4|nr:glutathione S-transferase [Piscinibacter sp. XHJ-5]
MLKIWGRLSSLNVQKVVWCANELGVPYERIDAGRQFGIVGTPAYERLNPNRLVPVIEDDGLVLWESNAIVRYLCARHAQGSLYPEPLAARADADRWMDWQATELSPAMSKAFVQLIRTAEPERDMALAEASVQAARPLMRILDRHLADREFVCGERITMADIPLGCAVHRWFGLPIEHGTLSAARRWHASLMKRQGTNGVLTLPLE